MEFAEIEAELEQIRRGRPRGAKSAHQPAALILSAQRAARGQDRVVPWRDMRAQLAEAIAAVGGSVDQETIAERVLGLKDSPIVDFVFSAPSTSRDSGPADRLLDERNPLLGLSDGVYQALGDRENLERFAKLAVDGLPDRQARSIREYFGIFAGFGEVPGVSVGALFRDRADLVKHGVHRNGQAGIVGTRERGAESVVVSGGYEDDKDLGDVIIYTGHGGRDQVTRRQIEDQTFDAPGNAGLVTSHVDQVPVRVIRRASAGYRYDGLFQVERYWSERGRSGFMVCRYRLVKVADEGGQGLDLPAATTLPSGNVAPERKLTTAARILRQRVLSRAVKELHDHRCQLCDIRLVIAGRGYAQGAHIRPLGQPHDGTDTADNLLCLCPNCHVLFDNGEILVADNFEIRSSYANRGVLRTVRDHRINLDNLAYHRGMFAGVAVGVVSSARTR
jgi:putative restriction endonuclease